jgi:hypothetical protein
VQRPFDGAQFGAQVGTTGLVLDVHRPAKHHQATIAIDHRLCVRRALKVDEANAMPASADQGVERAERLGGNVLEDQQARHGGNVNPAGSRHPGPTRCRQYIRPGRLRRPPPMKNNPLHLDEGPRHRGEQ